MGKFGIVEIMIVIFILLSPVVAAIIGIVLSKRAAKRSEEKWKQINHKFRNENTM